MNHFERLGLLRTYRSRAWYWRKLLRLAIDAGDDSEIIRTSLMLNKLEQELKAVVNDDGFILNNLNHSRLLGRNIKSAPDPLKFNEQYKIDKPNFCPSFE